MADGYSIPDEAEDSVVVTSHNLICGAPEHRQSREVRMFSLPMTITWDAFLDQALAAGWYYDEAGRHWLCPEHTQKLASESESLMRTATAFLHK